MQDEQYALLGGSTMVTRRQDRPTLEPERFVQPSLFATDERELAGQAAATDELGEVAE